MNSICIFRMMFPSVPTINGAPNEEVLRTKLNVLMNFTLKKILQQTYPTFTCIISYPPELEPLLLTALTSYNPLPAHIIFSPNLANISVFFLTITDATKSCLDPLNLSLYDYIYFIQLHYNTLCHPRLLEQLTCYTPHDSIRSLLFKNVFHYTPSTNILSLTPDSDVNDFIFVCSIEDYKRHFRIYDFVHPLLIYDIFKSFPSEYVFDHMLMTMGDTTLTTSDSFIGTAIEKNTILEEIIL